MNYVIITTNGELYHHGILGQRWGIRRYQNKDGSLTSAGKKRYSNNDNDNDDNIDNSNKNTITNEHINTSSNKKEVKNMSDEELRNAVNRLQMERNYTLLNDNNDYDYKKNKSVEYMSDEELRARINRLDMEKRYSSLTSNDINTGKNYVQKIISVGKTINDASSTAIKLYDNYKAIDQIMKEIKDKNKG